MAIPSGRQSRLALREPAQLLHAQARAEIAERFEFALALARISREHALDRLGNLFRRHVAQDLPREGPVGAVAAADIQMIALDLAVLARRDLGREQPDIADVVLRAGVVAAG